MTEKELLDKVRPWVEITLSRSIHLANGKCFALAGETIRVQHRLSDFASMELRAVNARENLASIGMGDVCDGA